MTTPVKIVDHCFEHRVVDNRATTADNLAADEILCVIHVSNISLSPCSASACLPRRLTQPCNAGGISKKYRVNVLFAPREALASPRGVLRAWACRVAAHCFRNSLFFSLLLPSSSLLLPSSSLLLPCFSSSLSSLLLFFLFSSFFFFFFFSFLVNLTCRRRRRLGQGGR